MKQLLSIFCLVLLVSCSQEPKVYEGPFLLKEGAKINYYDPSGEKKEFSKFKNVTFCSDIKEACNNIDLLVIHTEWEEFKSLDFKRITKKKNFKIFDMRNLYSNDLMNKKGFTYYSIGR